MAIIHFSLLYEDHKKHFPFGLGFTAHSPTFTDNPSRLAEINFYILHCGYSFAGTI